MIPQIQEVNFPSYATLHQASATFVEMGERSISTQVRIDGDVVPSFAGWELRFKGERFVLPTVEPQAAKDTSTRNSLVDLTFESWIIQQLKRYYFFEPASIDANTAIADKYVAPVRLSLANFVALFNKVLKYYFGTSVQMSLFQGVGTDDPAIVDINYSYLWDVLGKMFEIYNVRWRIAYENSVYVIKVGYPADTINDHDFEYGYKGGLLRFERQVQDQDIKNILLGRGGEKNLPYRYFKKMDQQSTGWTPDPDAIPELANISFDRLRDVNFRWYVRGWMQNPLCDQAYAPYPTYDESQIPDDYKFAYLKGKTDDRFNPVEYVKDDDSIEKYGEHWGAVDNNDDIYPTIQGRSRSGLGRIDAVVAVSEIVTDDIEGASKAVSEVTNIGGVKSMSTSVASGQTASKSFTGETFAVKAGMTGVITAMPFKEFGKNETQDAMVTMSLTVDVINASTGQVAATGSGQQITTGSIPTGTYYLRVTALLENHSTTNDLEGTFGLNEVKLQSAGYDTEEWKPTFDIWVKNIWGTTQGSGETDLAYTERVWLPILGDRAGNEAKVVFSDGFMSVSSDYEFVIAAYPVPDRTKTILVDGVEVQSEWKITLRKSDAEFETTGKYIPNADTGGKPIAGDHFFFIGIDMPFDYVLWGEEDVNTYKAAQLNKTAQVNPTWVINLDKVRVHTLEQGEYDTVLADRLAAGATVHVKDKRFTGGDVLTLYVQSMTYTWNEPTDDNPYIVPDIEVVLSDKVVSRTSVVEQIQGDVDVIRTQYAKIDDIEGVVRRVASPLFLKKTGESDKSLSPTQFAGKVSSDDFRQGDVGGAGWGAYTDGDGNAVYEVDKLVVRKELRVNNLVANQISYVGGKQINSAASIECVQVREESDGYVCYFDQKRGSIANLFVVGDYAMSQIFNPNDVEERYYRRRVNEVGENYIKLSKATGQVDGSGVPQVGDIIVQYGHESNTARQYAIVRDVIGGGYESMLMGLNSASAAGTEYYMSGRRSSLTGPRWFVGDTAGQHAEYYNGVLNITGRLSVSSQIEKSAGVYVGLSQYLNSLQDQIDGNIQSWSGDDDPLPVLSGGSVDPSTANYPASAWTTDTDRLKHMGDIYVNNTTGQGWRYTRQANDGDFYWMRITDEELADALQRISALETSVAGLSYLKAATNQGTLVEGGLVLTSLIQLGQTVNNVFTVWAGINGILDQTLANPLKSIAAWYGGPMRDLEMEGSGSGSGSGVSYAKSLFRMDGSGYLAGGNITWDNVGAGSIPGVHWDGNSVTIDGNVKLASTSGDSVTELLALVQELSSFFQKVNIGTAVNPVYAVKVRDEYAGLYSPGFLTAGGVGSGSGGGGGEIDLDRVWESLTNNTDKPNVEINIAHIPNITTSKVSDIETWIGNKGYLTSVAFSDLTSHPTTIAGYGITDAASIDDIAALSEGVAANSARLSSIEDWFKNPALDELQVNELNVLSEINGKIAWDNVIGKPSALPNPYALTFGSKSYDGSEAKEILASDIGAATVVRLEEDEAGIAASIQSLWAQIDAVSSRNNFDELTASALYSDIIAANSIYAEGIELNGADLATTLTNLAGRATTLEGYFTNGVANSAARLSGTSALNIWGVEYWLNGNPKAVTGRPNLYIGTTQVQTSSATQDLAGIGSISAAGAITLTTTKKIYFGDTDHFIELENIGTAGSPNWVFHFSHGVYSESFMDAGGLGSGGGGGGGMDIDRMWQSLQNNPADQGYENALIATAHIPDVSSIYGYIKAITSGMVTAALGYTPFNAASFTKANIQAALGISDWALASSKPGYSVSEISGLQTALNGKQDVINDLAVIRNNAANGNSAYNSLTTVSAILQSLQSQIDSVASRDCYDELTSTVFSADVAAISTLYAEVISLNGADLTTTLGTFVPKTTTVNGHALSGNITISKADVGLGSVENTALSTWAGTGNITTLGTITTGVWHGTPIANDYLANKTIGVGNAIITLGSSATLTQIGIPAWAQKAGLAFSDMPAMYIARTRVISGAANDTLLGVTAISNAASSDSNDETRIEWDATNHAWHFYGGIYADTSVVAGGVGSGGGGGSDIDLDRVWESLTNNTDFPDVKINLAHIPNIPWANILNTPTTLAGYGITDAKFGTAGSDYVPITLGSRTVNVLTAHQSLAGYATESWVGQQGFITKAVNDLTNYYLKSETYTQAEVNALIGAINQFRYEIAASTSAVTDPQSNVLYLIGPTGSGSDKYEEYVYANNTWTKIGDTSIDLTPYLTITAAAQTYQPIISDLATIRNNATHGETAYSDLATVSELLQSLQSQIDSVASRDCFDELTASVFYSDIAAVSDLYVRAVSLNGVDLAGSLSSLASRATSLESRATALEGRATSLESRATTLESYFTNGVANSALRLSGTATYSIWGVEYWSSGVPKSVTGRPGLYIGTTQVQTSAASQDLNGIAAINASGLATIAGGIKLTTTKKIYFGDTDHYLELDSNGFHFSHGVYSEDFITAGGIGSGGSGGGGIVDTIHRYADLGGTFSDSDNDVFNAYTVNKINTDLSARISQLEGGSATSITTTGSGNVVTGVSKAGTVITVTKGTTLGSLATLSSITTSYVTDLESWIAGKGYVTSSGVTSVGLSVPTGLSVSGSPVTGSGTLAITFASGYSIPTTAEQSAWSGKQDAISDLTTIRNNAANGATAYSWGNHASAGYLTSANGTTISDCLKSLQSQIDSVASKDMFDELTATVLHSDIVTASNAYLEAITATSASIANITGSLSGNATTASYLVGSSYAIGGGLNPVYFSSGRPVASTSTAGSASVPVYLNGGTLTAITPSSLFSALSSSAATNLSMTIAGQGRTIADLYARYDKDGGEIAPNMTTIGTALRSLQSQVDSVASRDRFDELNATVLFTDMLSVGGDTHIGGKIWFDSTHYLELKDGYLHTNLPIVSDSYITAGA